MQTESAVTVEISYNSRKHRRQMMVIAPTGYVIAKFVERTRGRGRDAEGTGEWYVAKRDAHTNNRWNRFHHFHYSFALRASLASRRQGYPSHRLP